MPKQPLVSVIVTTKNSARTLAACLESVQNQTHQQIELIVVDNQSGDSTQKIAQTFTKHVLTHGPERSAQRNAGVAAATGRYVLIIDSDMVLSSSVVSEAVTLMENSSNLQAVIIPEESFGSSFWARCKALEREMYLGLDWMESARFFRTKTFLKLGGYDEANTGTEDFDLPQRIKTQYGPESIGRIESLIYHDEGSLELSYTLAKKWYYAQLLPRYVAAEHNQPFFQKQANPVRRYGVYFSKPQLLCKKPIIGIGMLVMKSLEFGAGFGGYLYGMITRKGAR